MRGVRERSKVCDVSEVSEMSEACEVCERSKWCERSKVCDVSEEGKVRERSDEGEVCVNATYSPPRESMVAPHIAAPSGETNWSTKHDAKLQR